MKSIRKDIYDEYHNELYLYYDEFDEHVLHYWLELINMRAVFVLIFGIHAFTTLKSQHHFILQYGMTMVDYADALRRDVTMQLQRIRNPRYSQILSQTDVNRVLRDLRVDDKHMIYGIVDQQSIKHKKLSTVQELKTAIENYKNLKKMCIAFYNDHFEMINDVVSCKTIRGNIELANQYAASEYGNALARMFEFLNNDRISNDNNFTMCDFTFINEETTNGRHSNYVASCGNKYDPNIEVNIEELEISNYNDQNSMSRGNDMDEDLRQHMATTNNRKLFDLRENLANPNNFGMI